MYRKKWQLTKFQEFVCNEPDMLCDVFTASDFIVLINLTNIGISIIVDSQKFTVVVSGPVQFLYYLQSNDEQYNKLGGL